ncbi:MAG: type II toxin-antitoxin system RelB/DinJ family antitoxin [Eubacterium sp.]|jgi:addiction module RelB/DinJ family antitoxin|nr:type II toxin-antitoxin system RelB/DinJ family antitoxin [Eubacterium sp.]MCH4046559.1 type II toxin-antitoxin system RelB/DinJ family antitoxin [Eubacterium sp.]MCH4079654.1 type II toxin-antitoxin system RelB/DinJ family antitoxin [Eubacterium sp.]MCH4110212.1 type II toxin-antitoxin system RelB/DinJ family antitoxin [Eubacterium sp.]MCI1308017.1 type II toxin-antitoxin system RelB/DinJ family antitoxin [Eubacterium sp.]
MSNSYIQIRTDAEDKKEASEILNALGTNLSAVLNMTIKQIILQRRIPFDVALPEEKPVSKSVQNVVASLEMEGLPLSSSQMNDLEDFEKQSKETQENNIRHIVDQYKPHGGENA